MRMLIHSGRLYQSMITFVEHADAGMDILQLHISIGSFLALNKDFRMLSSDSSTVGANEMLTKSNFNEKLYFIDSNLSFQH